MNRLTILCLMPFLLLTMSCSTLSKTKEKLDFLNAKLDNLKVYTQDELAKMKVKATKADSDLAAVGIILDVDKDGRVTKDEAVSAMKDLATGAISDGEKRRLLFDPDLWIGVTGAVVTSFGAAVVASRNRRTKAELKKLRDSSANV